MVGRAYVIYTHKDQDSLQSCYYYDKIRMEGRRQHVQGGE